MDPQAFVRSIDEPFSGDILTLIGGSDFIAMKCFAGERQDITHAHAPASCMLEPIETDLPRHCIGRSLPPMSE